MPFSSLSTFKLYTDYSPLRNDRPLTGEAGFNQNSPAFRKQGTEGLLLVDKTSKGAMSRVKLGILPQ